VEPLSRSKPAISRRLLRLKAAATYLSVSIWTLRGMIQRGELPVIQNGAWLLDMKDLDLWIERQKTRLG